MKDGDGTARARGACGVGGRARRDGDRRRRRANRRRQQRVGAPVRLLGRRHARYIDRAARAGRRSPAARRAPRGICRATAAAWDGRRSPSLRSTSRRVGVPGPDQPGTHRDHARCDDVRRGTRRDVAGRVGGKAGRRQPPTGDGRGPRPHRPRSPRHRDPGAVRRRAGTAGTAVPGRHARARGADRQGGRRHRPHHPPDPLHHLRAERGGDIAWTTPADR